MEYVLTYPSYPQRGMMPLVFAMPNMLTGKTCHSRTKNFTLAQKKRDFCPSYLIVPSSFDEEFERAPKYLGALI
jgi:hypothetical protein